MDKTIKELYVSPELESLEMAMRDSVLQDVSGSTGNGTTAGEGQDMGLGNL